jgi:hypothetical protein
MDFRVPNEHEESDAAILNEPYRPFYNIFGSKPILVKQYEVANYDGMVLQANCLKETMTTTA